MNQLRSKNNTICLLLALMTVGLLSCSKTPSGVLDQEEMASLMADMHTAEAVVDMNYTAFSTDSLRKSLKQSVLLAHNTDQAAMDSSLNWYGNHIEDYIKVYDRTIELLEERQRTVASNASSRMAIAGDSVDVWNGARHVRVSKDMPLKLLTFAIEPDSNWRAGDVYLLRYKAIGNQRPVDARLLVDYSDGRTNYATPTDRLANAHYSLRLPLDSTRTVNRVYGYIAPLPGNAENFHIDSISLVRMRRAIAGYDYSPITSLTPGERQAHSSLSPWQTPAAIHPQQPTHSSSANTETPAASVPSVPMTQPQAPARHQQAAPLSPRSARNRNARNRSREAADTL